jgi:hypothetical protein
MLTFHSETWDGVVRPLTLGCSFPHFHSGMLVSREVQKMFDKMKRLTGAMKERGFCTWLALTWNSESGVDAADFAFLETSLGMRG